MAYFPNTSIQASDSGSIDAFGRWRTSNPLALFDSKQLHDNSPLVWDQVTNGSATSTHSTTDASTTMTVAASGDYVIRQSKMRFNYQAGKSQQILCTFVLGSTTSGVTKRVGYFNSSTAAPYTATFDGLYLEDDGTGVGLCIGKSGTVTRFEQADWNLDKMDGTGPSGITLDFTNSQILLMDFEWLGVGRVRYGFVIGGLIYYVHQHAHANNEGSVYMSSPNHSMRYEIRSSGGSGSFEHICSAVSSEGGVEDFGVNRSSDMGQTSMNPTDPALTYALLGIRLKSTHLDSTVIVTTTNCIATTVNDYFLLKMILNPTVAGTFNYSDLTNSAVQTATGVVGNTITGGTILWATYASQSSRQLTISTKALPRIGSTIAGVQDTMVLAIQPVSGNQIVLASMSWFEQG